jgi:succinate dehydrogenase / fumarate reductase membrane anchor subunit
VKETKYWTWHVTAGVVICIFLGLHMIIMHLDHVIGWFLPEGGSTLAWSNVIARSRMVFFILIYTVLLGAALFHGLYGFRSILFELNPSRILKNSINIVFWLIGLGLFSIGTLATIAVKIG